MQSPLALVLDTLRAAGATIKPQKKGYVATCPVHGDKHPSLAVGEGDTGAVVLKCRAGCSTADVVKALDLEMSDLFPPKEEQRDRPPRRTPAPKLIVAKVSDGPEEPKLKVDANKWETPPTPWRFVQSWAYRTKDGIDCYEVGRFECEVGGVRFKTCRQRQRNDKGAWVGGVNKSTPRPLYMAQEVDEAIRAGRIIYLVEGEKCADALIALGLDATTNSGGASGWRPEHAESLRGAIVAVLPDNDDPGAKLADQSVGALVGVASVVRRVILPGLPPKGDVADWLAAHTGDKPAKLRDLRQAVLATVPEGSTAEVAVPDRFADIPAPTEGNGANDDRPILYRLYSGLFAERSGEDWKTIKSGDVVKTKLHEFYPELDDDDVNAKMRHMPHAEAIMFDPRTPERVIPTPTSRVLNSYRPIRQPPEGPANLSKCANIVALIDHLFPEPRMQAWFIKWLAMPLQSLWKGEGPWRTQVILVLHGIQGTGKGWLMEIVEQLYQHTFCRLNQDAIEEKFAPKGIRSALFFNADEVRIAENAVVQKFKTWSTESSYTTPVKFDDQLEHPLYFNTCVTCNYDHPVHLEGDDDRRYAFERTRVKLAYDLEQRLVAMKKAGWQEVPHFAAFLRDVVLVKEAMKPLDNDARANQLKESRSPAVVFAEQLKAHGIESMADAWVRSQNGKDIAAWMTIRNGAADVNSTVFYAIYQAWMKNVGKNQSMSVAIAEMAREIPTMLFADAKGGAPRRMIDGKQQRCVVGVPIAPEAVISSQEPLVM